MKKLYVAQMWNPDNDTWCNLEFWVDSFRECLEAWPGPDYRVHRITSREEAETLSKNLCNTFGPFGNEWDLDTYDWDWGTETASEGVE